VTRFVCACTTIVAAFHVQLAAAAVAVEDVPIPGGVAVLSRALAIDPAPDRGRFMYEATRLVYETVEIRTPAVAAFLLSIQKAAKNKSAIRLAGAPSGSEAVPVPLTVEIWGEAIFRRRVAREELVMLILADRQAALLCHGLGALDDETLEYFASHPDTLTRIYERAAPNFAAFAGSLRVRDNRVVPAGDADAVPLWEAVVGEKVTRADRFISALFEQNEGRIAYLYDTIGQLDARRRAFALGTWLPTAAARLDRFKALGTTGLSSLREWHTRLLPFGRASFDLGMIFLRLEVAENGAPRPPASRGLFARALFGTDVADDAPIDAAWLAENVVATDVRQRSDRLDQIAFAQRVFGGVAGDDRAELAFVLRSFSRYRALMLTFERMGVTRVATYAAVIRHAAKLSALDGRRGYVAQAQLQGALVLLARMTNAGTLSVASAERLIDRLVSVHADGAATGRVARWLRDDLHPALPAARDMEGAIVAGLSGRTVDAATVRRVTWEGQHYRLDFAASERNRLQRVREKQHAPAIDLPLQMADVAHVVAGDKASLEDMHDAVTQLTAIAADLPPRSREEEADNVPAGVAVGVNAHEVVKKAIDELAKAARSKELKRAVRIADPIAELADDLLARNLLSFAYATSVGDPEGTVLLADDVSHRHDFGFGLKDAEMRARVAWAIPRQEVSPSAPWHVSGSLLGLDVALSTLALRRVATDHVLEAPKLTSNARDTFAASISLMDPLALADRDRDAIANAIEQGRRRAQEATDARRIDVLADELRIDHARRRAMRWTIAHERGDLTAMLSMTELVTLGGARLADLQAWGMAVTSVNGCLCSRVLPPGVWATLTGRPQLGLAAAVVPDVNFRIAVILKELDLPAPLAKIVLSAAMQDFIDEARPTDDSDWLSLSRAARAITRERVEDYVAAATATGPLMPDVARSPVVR
jgi:hypothetical protein